ncbi:MAG TPA: hypothetical protein VKT82_21115 [Ktedonobacterales bacterium]|nr:hypothetical protein [Ktedonobacterales bacterium]
MSNRTKTLIGLGVFAFLVISVGLIVLFSILGIWPQVRDVALVVLAVATFGALGLLSYAVFVMISLGLQVKKELTPVLDSLRDTTDTVRETAKVASELTVTPGVRVASTVLGAAQMAGIFFGTGRARKRAEKRAQRRREMAEKGELDGYR